MTYRQRITAGPEDRAAIGIELGRLLAAYPSQDPTPAGSALRIDAYATAIGTAPLWAIVEARTDVLTGRAVIADWNRSFAPSPTQFADLVNAILHPYRRRLSELEGLAVIAAEFSPSPAERERVAAGFASLRQELRPSTGQAAVHRKAEDGLRERAAKLGLDFDAAMASIPDAPQRIA